MKTDRRDLRDWFIITAIILLGFLCLIIAGSMAIRFSPRWQLSANMDSHLDPNSNFLTNRPQGYIEPVDQSILTPAFWIDFFQTPGAFVPPRTPLPTRTAAPTSTSAVVPTAIIPVTVTLTPTNPVVYVPPSRTNTPRPGPPYTDTPTYTNTPTNTLSVEADLQITKNDGVLMYSAGSTLTYTVIVTNNGPANVTGAVITDNRPAQIQSWTWKCTSENGGATGCYSDASNNPIFSNTVDLPNGASIEYEVIAIVLASASGDLINTAQVAVPATNTETNVSNNQASDTDQFLAASTLPSGNIGETRDGVTDFIKPGESTSLRFSTPLVVSGHAGYDLVYYELPNGSGIAMDIVALEISDGNNWYTVFYWGDDIADTNSNLNINDLGGPEIDNRDFTSPPAGLLYDGTGILIELDGVVPPGIYPYIRIISPPTAAYPLGTDLDGGCDVDAFAVLQ